MENKKEYCIVNTNTLSLYSYCNVCTLEVAENKLQQAIETNQKDIETWASHCKNYPDTKSFECYLQTALNNKFKIATYDEFLEMQKSYYVNKPLIEIDYENFNYMLNVLPPLKWTTKNNVEMFCMSEMLTGCYTSQYAHDKTTNKYYTKVVDITDTKTWIDSILRA